MSFSQNTPTLNNKIEHKQRQGNTGCRQQQVALFLGLLAFICAIILFGLRAKLGLRLFDFGDESEKFVAAQMLNQGLHLYRDIFAHHGPIPYMIAHLYTNVVSSTDFSHSACSCIFGCSLLSVDHLQHNSQMFHCSHLGGCRVHICFIIGLDAARNPYASLPPDWWFLVGDSLGADGSSRPAGGEKMTGIGLFVSGFSLTLACFSAYAFGPAAVLLVISTFLSLMASQEKLSVHVKNFFLGILSAFSIVVCWLIFFGDLLGYLVYHFYFNQEIYAAFIRFSPRAIFNAIHLSFTPQRRVDTLYVTFLMVWTAVLVFMALYKSQKIKAALFKIGAIFFLFVAILFVNPRGMFGFYSAGVVVINFAVISLMAALLLQNQLSKSSWPRLILPLFFMALLVVGTAQVSRNALSSPYKVAKKDFLAYVADQKPEQGGIYDFIRSITSKDDKVLSLVFNPSLYIKLGRLPASGHYYYFPWQAKYNRASVLDYKIDICKDIIANRPPVIWFDNWKVWGGYAIGKYEPCVPELIKSRYTPLNGERNYYIRNDIAHEMMLDVSLVDYTMRPGSQLTRSAPFKLSMMINDTGDPTQLKRIGVMFGTSGRQNPGDAELRLHGPDGAEFEQRFSLPDLTDRKYRYFDLTPAQYTSGEIVSVTGEGFSAWESYNAKGDVRTCIIYEHNNGKKRLTPGCPFF